MSKKTIPENVADFILKCLGWFFWEEGPFLKPDAEQFSE